MKKYVCLIVLCALFLCSCGTSDEEKINVFFQKNNVRFSCNGITYSYAASGREFQTENGSFAGMKIKYTDIACTAIYDDFLIETGLHTFPHLDFFDQLWRAYTDAKADVSISDSGALVLIVDSSRFLVYYNKDNENVSRIVAETDYGVFEYILDGTEEES